MKWLTTIGFLTIALLGMAQRVKFSKYFPLQVGDIKTYAVMQILPERTFRDGTDSSICKSISIEGKEVFYFERSVLDRPVSIIATQIFCDGACYYEKGKLIFSPLFWYQELEDANLDYFEMLFPKRIRFGHAYKYHNGKEKRGYTFGPFETITIGERSYERCLKLTIEQDWATASYTDVVWFQEDVGVVKWLRGTGRLEEVEE
jgi:hypothetical protein